MAIMSTDQGMPPISMVEVVSKEHHKTEALKSFKACAKALKEGYSKNSWVVYYHNRMGSIHRKIYTSWQKKR